MMSLINVRRQIVYLVAGLFLVVNLSTLSYAETNYGELLTILQKGELNKIMDDARKALERNPDDKDSLTTLGVAYHNLSTIGVKKAAQKAVEYLKKANKLYPDDALVLAMLGSSTTLIGKYAKDKVTEGRKYTNKGAGLIDRAVMKDPDHILVRMVRANNSRGLPKMFGRRHYFRDDMLHVEKLINKSPGKFHVILQSQVYYKLGTAFASDGDDAKAKSYYKKSFEVAPDSKFGKKAKREL
ncbi:MAG: tetratricopeptide repeat protein [Nitrospirota bacterium]